MNGKHINFSQTHNVSTKYVGPMLYTVYKAPLFITLRIKTWVAAYLDWVMKMSICLAAISCVLIKNKERNLLLS